ncbi:MAG: BatD family protein, partial [Gammaproteobacteria bacterium]
MADLTFNRLLILLLFLLTMAAGQTLHANTIEVTTDRDQVSMNQSFNIIFRAEGAVDGDPDFSPLEKNFQILSTSQSSNFSLINGELERSKSWTLTVLPRHSGNLTIPSIAFGSDRSPRASIQVEERESSQDADNQGEIFLRAEVSPDNPYVQSQVTYTLKLYRAVPTSNAVLNDPQIAQGDAVIERIGEDKVYLTRVDGRRYRVVERRFAVYPQASGTLKIAPVEFRGHVSGSSRSLFDPFGPQSEIVIRRSNEIALEVRPVPEDFAGRHWFPARKVTLEEKWSRDPKQFRVGEPITRTLTLTAEGQTASQLPELPGWISDGLRHYPDQPVLENETSDTGMIGRRRESTALIPQQPGEYTLAAIRIPWWSTRADRMEYAELPARTVTVAAAPGEAGKEIQDAKPAPLGDLKKPEPAAKPNKESVQEKGEAAARDENGSTIWLYLSVALVLIWLFTVLAWWFSARRRNRSGDRTVESRRRVLREIKKACLEQDPRRAREQLLQWGRLNWPANPPLNPLQIGERIDPELEKAINRMNDILYGNHTEQWDGDAFWRLFEATALKQGKGKKGERGKLEPL